MLREKTITVKKNRKESRMKRNDLEPNEENIRKSIELDCIGRNQKLANFIRLLNSIDENYVISLDGEWGSGKTFFVQQLLYFYNHEITDNFKIYKTEIDTFKEKYIPIYYNAWECDDHVDPLESLTNAIVTKYANTESFLKKKGKDLSSALGEVIVNLLETSTGGLFTKEVALKATNNFKEYVENVGRLENRKKMINSLFDDLLNNDKRILLIIDDLDRSRPDFAIKLLEVLKHFYNNRKITVIVATNNRQLAYSVEHVYGNKTDGYKYLNRIYDTTIYLQTEISEKYMTLYHGLQKGGLCIEQLMEVTCNYFNFSYRDCNRYVAMYRIVEKYTQGGAFYSNETENLLRSSMLIFALGLKIIDVVRYEEFISGRGQEELKEFLQYLSLEKNDKHRLFSWLYFTLLHNRDPQPPESNKEAKIDEIVKQYELIFDDNDAWNNMFAFKEAVSLLGNSASYDNASIES